MRTARLLVSLGVVLLLACRPDSTVEPAAPVPVLRAQANGTYVLQIDEIVDLGTLPGHTWSEAHDINESGVIVGTSQVDVTTKAGARAVRWPTPTSAPISLGTLGGTWSDGWGVSDLNLTIVGNSVSEGSSVNRGFKWTPRDGIKDLGLIGRTAKGSGFPTVAFSAAAVSSVGTIVGTDVIVNQDSVPGGYLLDDSGNYYLVPQTCTSGYLFGTAADINESGQHVGALLCFEPFNVNISAYLATLSSMTDLSDHENGSARSLAHGVNNAGAVVGESDFYTIKPQYRRHAFRWEKSIGMRDLHFKGDTLGTSVAREINSDKLVVGEYSTGTVLPEISGFVHGGGLAMTKLPPLCPKVVFAYSTAYAINDNGWIVGGSSTCSGQRHATLWKVRVLFIPYFP
jgi:probable HAF family extracellular repeat protein